MSSKSTFLARLIGSALLILGLSPIALAQEGAQLTETSADIASKKLPIPPELVQLRERLSQSLAGDFAPLHQDYVKKLAKLRDQALKKERFDKVGPIEARIEAIEKLIAEPKTLRIPQKEELIPSMRIMTMSYERKLKEACKIRKSEFIYRLKNLEQKILPAQETDSATAIRHEINRVKHGTSILDLFPPKLPKTAEELNKWLLDTTWSVRTFTSSKGIFIFHGEKEVTILETKLPWKATGPRSFTIYQPKGLWTLEFTISEDLKRFTGGHKNHTNGDWVGNLIGLSHD